MERGIWGVGIFAYFAKKGEFWERVEGELVLQGNLDVVESGGGGGGGSRNECVCPKQRQVLV